MRRISPCLASLFMLALLLFTTAEAPSAASASALAAANPRPLAFEPDVQTPDLFYNEALTVYYGNLARRANNVPPLRWNRELTLSARWFAWDSVENEPPGFCDHRDSQGNWPSDRNTRYGYPGANGAENAYCGFMQPQDAIDGWMDSPGHRANLLDANSTEIGMGYYRRASDGRGYLVQDFGRDVSMPPVIINNEAPNTTSQQVQLYIHSNKESSGFTTIAPAKQMRISNGSCAGGVSWEPYQAEKAWTLSPGEGWKTVTAQIRDAMGRSVQTNDTIYLGANVPVDQLAFSQLSQASSQVTLYNLNSGGMPYAQFSLGWMADDSDIHFGLGSDNSKPPSDPDPAALGGTAFKMSPGGYTWLWDWEYNEFPDNQDMVAYFRLKTSSNTSSGNIVHVGVGPGASPDVGLDIKGTDFTAANRYQEFAVPFHYVTSADDKFLIFDFSLTGSATVWVDGVTIFSKSYPISGSTYTWNVPGNHYRGQGVWVRYADGQGRFTGFQDADTSLGISASANQLTWMAACGRTSSHKQIEVSTCGVGSWTVKSAPAWLEYTISGNSLDVYVDAAGLAANTYQENLVLESSSPVSTVVIPIKLVVAETIYEVSFPSVWRQ